MNPVSSLSDVAPGQLPGRRKSAGPDFGALLMSVVNSTKTSTAAAGKDAGPAPVPGSLDEWLQTKISGGGVPKTVAEAGEKAERLSGYLSGIYSAAFKDAGIPGSHGLSPVFVDGEFRVVGRLVATLPDRMKELRRGPSGFIQAGEIVQTGEGVGSGVAPAPKPVDFDYYGQMITKMIDECLKEAFDKEQSDTLGEFSFNKAITELSKFKPEFKKDFEKDPSSALDNYRDDILFYMESALFPVKGD